MPSTRDLGRVLTGLLSLLLACAVLVGAPTTARAEVNAPEGLTPNGTAEAGVPTLQWDPVGGADRYTVQVSDSPEFNTLLASATTYNHRYVPSVALPASGVHWRVRALVGSVEASPWSAGSFTRIPLAGPTAVSPEDGALLEQPGEPPVLTWAPVANAVRYEIQVDDDDDFIGATSGTTSTTSYLVPNPQPATQFWWQVRAVIGNGINTEWSTPRSYRVGGLNEVEPVLPAEQERIEDIVFDWDAVPGAKDYELRISNDQEFNNLVPVAGKTIVVKGTRYSPPTTLDNDEYWWQVRARDAAGNTIGWDALDGAGERRVPVRHFQRHWPDAPTLTYPRNSVTDVVHSPFYFEWTPVEHASKYELHVGTRSDFSPGTYSRCYTHATTYTPGFTGPDSVRDFCNPAPGSTYYWRVRALDDPAGVIGEWSAIQGFTYDNRVVQTSGPTGGNTVAVPTLRWQPFSGAEKYRVELFSSASSYPVDETETYALSWTPTPSRALDPADGPYRWSVTAIDHNGRAFTSRMSTAMDEFEIGGAFPVTGAAPLTPLTPDTTASTTFPALKWEPHPDAAYYRVWVGVHGTGTFQALPSSASTSAPPQNFVYPEATDITTRWLSRGTYDWKVEAFTEAGAPLLSSDSVGTFTVLGLDSVSGQRVALTGTSLEKNACSARLDASAGPRQCTDLQQTPVLDWAPVAGASHYMVYLFKDDRLTNSVYPRSTSQPTRHLVTTQNTRWTPVELLPDNQAGDGYYWFIRPCKAPSVCAPDPTAASNSFDKSSLPVDVSDSRNVTTAANEFTLYWNSTLAENQEPENAQLLTTGGEATRATVEAQRYRVQVSADPTFKVDVHEVLVDQPTFTPFSRTFPEGPLYWRVQSIDGTGNALTWSPTRTINKGTPAPTLTSPAAGSVVEGTPYFRWQPQDFASAYELEVYANGDTTLSRTNRAIQVTTSQAAYTDPEPLPTTSASYYWRVRRLDADKRPGAWTALRAFTISGQAPGQVFPTAAAVVPGDAALFAWEAVPGAASYKFERRTEGATYSSETITTVGQAWAPTALLKDGRWEWRVSAVDSQRKIIASSPWRDFTVDSEAPSVTGAPTAPLRAGSNWAVTFSEPVEGVDTTTMRLHRADQADPLSASLIRSDGGRTWTLDPAAAMAGNVDYTLSLTSGITDRAGNALSAVNYSRSFSMDATRPRVVRKAPGRFTTRTANWKVTFSEPVRGISGRTMRLYRAGTTRSVRARLRGSNGGRTWTLDPARALSRRVRYTLKMTGGITDRVGNRLRATSYSSKVVR